MRRNSVRHFVHMVIDILPLLIIPIFALNILHKETEPISIDVQENISVDFNQKVQNGNFDNSSNWVTNGAYFSVENNTLKMIATRQSGYVSQAVNFVANHKYYVNCWLQLDTLVDYDRYYLRCNANGNSLNIWAQETLDWQQLDSLYTCTISGTGVLMMDNRTQQNYLYFKNVMVIDLTQMYGVGNEPTTKQEFKEQFSNSYYDYTLSKQVLINNGVTTYNSTDIGSQFIYALYKPVHDYFNFNNLFNMGAIYNWIELNLFSGTSPLPIFIIWNVIVYEFFVDLIFLLYGVFMFIIDFATNCLDTFTRKGRKGV